MSGTPITNANATTDVPSNYEICQVSGFKAKRGELVRRWDGLWVKPEFCEKRNDQDFVRVSPERQRGAMAPEPVDNPTFIETQYPNGVSASDL